MYFFQNKNKQTRNYLCVFTDLFCFLVSSKKILDLNKKLKRLIVSTWIKVVARQFKTRLKVLKSSGVNIHTKIKVRVNWKVEQEISLERNRNLVQTENTP